MKQEHYLVYRTTHIPTGRFYIGRHVTRNLADGYLGSGTVISRLLKAHPREEFVREVILDAPTSEEMLTVEDAIIEVVLNEPLCMNCARGDPQTIGIIRHSAASKARMSDAKKGKSYHTAESRKKLSVWHTGKEVSDVTRKKMSLYASQKPEEHRRKQAESLKKHWEQNSEAWKRSFKDRAKMSEETRARWSERRSGAGNSRAITWLLETEQGATQQVTSIKTWCVENGIKYTSLLYTEKSGKFYSGYKIRRIHG